MALPGLTGCNPFKEYPKNIQEFAEPWQTLEPGKPLDKTPRIEIVTQGQGPVVEPGDLVQLQVAGWHAHVNRQSDYGDWWLWIGFRSGKETPFFGLAPTVATGLIGLQQGTSLKFLDPSGDPMDARSAGELRPSPFGDPNYFSWRKYTTDFMRVSIPNESGHLVITIKRVCKGKVQYRSVRLFDDSPVKVGQGFQTWTSHEPREMWIDQAQVTAPCSDGKTAFFQYGPAPSSGKEARMVVSGYFDNWFSNAWQKIPERVQFQNNRAPIVKDNFIANTTVGKPVKIDLMANAMDPDGDPETIRIVKPASNGIVTTSSAGKFTYTPNQGWRGGDGFTYKASDGLVESNLGQVRIYVRAE